MKEARPKVFFLGGGRGGGVLEGKVWVEEKDLIHRGVFVFYILENY